MAKKRTAGIARRVAGIVAGACVLVAISSCSFAAPSARAALPGLIISQAGSFNAQTVEAAYKLASTSGAKLTRYYASWTDIESSQGTRNWKGTDFIMNLVRKYHLKLSVSFNVIQTGVRSPIPADLTFTGWNQPTLIDRLSDFVNAFIRRYADLVDYVEIGNEVNDYFALHPGEIADYRSRFEAVRANIRKSNPNMMVGIVFAFGDLYKNNDYSTYKALNVGDFDGFTLYLYDANFQFDRSPSELTAALTKMAQITGRRPFGIEEVGWSPWSALSGSVTAQSQAVDTV
jgi:hypothetical protein